MMRYLNGYKIFEDKNNIDSICKEYRINNYTIRPDGRIDVDGGVHLYSKNLSKLPLNFNIVSGNFNCSHNQLTSLEHCPSEIGGDFYCSSNQLTTLKGCRPSEIGGDFYCNNNQLTSLEHCPSEIGGNFNCSYNKLTTLKGCRPSEIVGNFYCFNNQLTSLKGAPSEVGGDFYCNNNKLTSLEHCPQQVGGGFYCNNNQITSLEYCSQQIGGDFYCTGNPVDFIVRGFIRSRKKNELIELFNYTDIIQDGDVVIYDRLVWFYEEIGIRLPNMGEIAKHYKIIK